MVCPVTVQELPLAGPGKLGAPRAAQLTLLPAQFLFLVLRSCDERGFSSHTSSERLGGAGPPTAASLRLPLPFRALGLQTQKRGCLAHPTPPPVCSPHDWKPCRWVKTWVSPDTCTPWLLLLSPTSPPHPGPDICGPGPCWPCHRGVEGRGNPQSPLPTSRGAQAQRGVSWGRPVVPTSWQGWGELRSWGSA